MIFNDRSSSMWGPAFSALKTANKNIRNIVFDDKGKLKDFETMNVAFYHHSIDSTKVENWKELDEVVEREEANGQTDFVICFKNLE